LLTGERAQRIHSRTPAEVERVICETEATRPSLAAPRRLGRQLRGDLDNIVLMAIRKDRSRRYQSVDQMAEDIGRHLAGLPVIARQDSFSYRSWKYVRRHRWSLSAACLIAASLIAGATVARSEARQAEAARQAGEVARRGAEKQRQIADRERARAEAEALVARAESERSALRLSEMVDLADRSLYDVHSAIQRLPGATEARRQIVATTLKFLENLSRDAGQDDRLRYVLSVAYSKVADVQGDPLVANLGDRPGALANYEKARQWIAPLLAKEPGNPLYLLQFARVQTNVGGLLIWEGQRERAIAIFRAELPAAAKLAVLRSRDSESRRQEALIYSNLMTAYHSVDYAQALVYARKEVELLVRVAKDFPADREAKLALAGAYSQLGQALHATTLSFTEPVEPYRQSIALREQAVAENPADALARRGLMISYANLAALFYSPDAPSAGDPASAAEYYGKTVSIARELVAGDTNDRLAEYDLANALLRRYGWLEPTAEERETSLATLRQAVEILTRLVTADPNSVTVAATLVEAGLDTGHRLRELGRLPEAVAAYRRSLEVAERLGAANPKVMALPLGALAAEEALATVLAMQGDRTAPETARKAIARAEQFSKTAVRRDRAQSLLAEAYGNLGVVYQTMGDCAAARDAATKAVAQWKALADSGGLNTKEREEKRAEELLRRCEVAER
jgi:tetratricopeptide (TPR) repeat protein